MNEEENTKDVTIVKDDPGGEVITRGAFGMTIEQAEQQIEHTLKLYTLAKTVIKKLLNPDDIYYMSTIGKKDAKPKDDESPVINKQGVDKLIGFFKIETFPTEEKVSGGYKVTVVGKDRSGRYIATGTGVCTRYEKKYIWIKADDEEYAAAEDKDRRTVERKGKYNSYTIKQIRTDERGIAHTLLSMAEKRARAAFLRKALPGLSDVSFEGEGADSDYQYAKPEQTPSNTVMTDAEITAFKGALEQTYSKAQINEAIKGVTGGTKVKGMTQEVSLAVTTYLTDNCHDK